jgi:hypothetical protein
MTSPVPRACRRAIEILRWRGPGHFFLLALREVFRPLMYWYAWNIYLTDLQQPLTQPYGKRKFDVRIISGNKDREMAREQLASLGEPLPANFDARINRGDALAVVYLRRRTSSVWLDDVFERHGTGLRNHVDFAP